MMEESNGESLVRSCYGVGLFLGEEGGFVYSILVIVEMTQKNT